MGQTQGGNAGNLELIKQVEEQRAEIEALKKIVEITGKLEVIGITSVEEMDNPGDETGKLKIYYGVINNIAYISFDIRWIKLQFKIPGASKVLARVVYGHTAPLEWKEI